jgi:hypothetical protein
MDFTKRTLLALLVHVREIFWATFVGTLGSTILWAFVRLFYTPFNLPPPRVVDLVLGPVFFLLFSGLAPAITFLAYIPITLIVARIPLIASMLF